MRIIAFVPILSLNLIHFKLELYKFDSFVQNSFKQFILNIKNLFNKLSKFTIVIHSDIKASIFDCLVDLIFRFVEIDNFQRLCHLSLFLHQNSHWITNNIIHFIYELLLNIFPRFLLQIVLLHLLNLWKLSQHLFFECVQNILSHKFQSYRFLWRLSYNFVIVKQLQFTKILINNLLFLLFHGILQNFQIRQSFQRINNLFHIMKKIIWYI